MKKLQPIILILLCSVINLSSCCCEQKERVSSLLDAAIDLISKVKSENISCTEEHNFPKLKPMDCTDLYLRGYNKSGVYAIWPISRISKLNRLDVYCDMTDGGWTVIQRRGDYERSADYFNQDWESYKKGFGSLERDFWLGNDNIFAMTNQRPYSAYFYLECKEQTTAYAQYDNFWIDDEFNNYTLHISGYRGTAGDSMKPHNTMKFTTNDRDNDLKKDGNCGTKYKSGWWFNDCYYANLNGLYYNETFGINWYEWRKTDYLPLVEIKIKTTIF